MITTKGSHTLQMNVWVIVLVKLTRSTKVMSEDEKNFGQAV